MRRPNLSPPTDRPLELVELPLVNLNRTVGRSSLKRRSALGESHLSEDGPIDAGREDKRKVGAVRPGRDLTPSRCLHRRILAPGRLAA